MEILGSGLHQEDSRLLWDGSIMEDRNSCQSQRPFAVIQQGEHEVCPRGQKRQKNPEEDSQVLRHGKTRVGEVKKKKGQDDSGPRKEMGEKSLHVLVEIYSKN